MVIPPPVVQKPGTGYVVLQMASTRLGELEDEAEAGWQSPSLHRLPERPFRTVLGGILRKFLRRLSQFPPSFLAKSRWAPRSSGELRSRLCQPAEEICTN